MEDGWDTIRGLLGAGVIIFMIVVIAVSCVAGARKDGVCVGAGYDECVYEASGFWCIHANESGELIGVPYDTVLEQATR